ncbi:hypothetical protein BDD14_3643 [Edaphobacter modestus]|uniref:Uncharacterized protein n=1 Tax=Edaphobacter modestus TaxID=388466 RepID=A0A4Q7YWA8_9BACT|nr:hypothetical protein BDD14_3643 [Edaphobacter modestus]
MTLLRSGVSGSCFGANGPLMRYSRMNGAPGTFPLSFCKGLPLCVERRRLESRFVRCLSEDLGQVFGAGVCALGDLLAAAEAVGDDDGLRVVADGGQEDALA